MREKSPVYTPDEMLRSSGIVAEASDVVDIDDRELLPRYRMLRDAFDRVRRGAGEVVDRARRTFTGKNTPDEFISRLRPWQKEDFQDFMGLSVDRIVADAEKTAVHNGSSFNRDAYADQVRSRAEFSKEGVGWLERWRQAQGGRKEAQIGLYNEMIASERFNAFEKHVYQAYAQKTILVALRAAIEDEFLTEGGKSDSMDHIMTAYGNDYQFLSNLESAMQPTLVTYVVDQNRRLIAVQRQYEIYEQAKNNLEYKAPDASAAVIDVTAGKFGYVKLFTLEDASARLERSADVTRMQDVMAWLGRGYDRLSMVNGKQQFVFGPQELFYEGYDSSERSPKVRHVMREAAKRLTLACHYHGDITIHDDRAYVAMERAGLTGDKDPNITDPVKLEMVCELEGFNAFKKKVIDNGSVVPDTFTSEDELNRHIANVYAAKMFRFRSFFWAAGDLATAVHPLVAFRRSSRAWEVPDDFFDIVDQPTKPNRIYTLASGKQVAVFVTTRGGTLKRFQVRDVLPDGSVGEKSDYSLLAFFETSDFERMADAEEFPNPAEVANRLRTMRDLNRKFDAIAKNRRVTSEELRSMFISGEGAAVYSQVPERNLVMARLIRCIERDEYSTHGKSRNPDKLTVDMQMAIHRGAYAAEHAIYIYSAIGRLPAEWHLPPNQWEDLMLGRYDVQMMWPYDEWLYNRDPEAYERFMRVTYNLPEDEEIFVGGMVLDLTYKYLFREFATGEVTIDDYLQYYGMVAQDEYDEEAGVYVVRVKKLEQVDPARARRILADPHRGLSRQKARFLKSIHNVDIAAVVQTMDQGNSDPSDYPKDNTSLMTDPTKRSVEVAEVFFKYLYGPTAYGGGALKDFQTRANNRSAISPLSREVVINLSNGIAMNRDDVYRYGEAVPVMDVLTSVAEMVHLTPLEMAPDLDEKTLLLLGGRRVQVKVGNELIEDLALPTVRKNYVDPYLQSAGYDEFGYVSLTALRRREVGRNEVMFSRSVAAGSMDFLEPAEGLEANILHRRPIYFTQSLMAREIAHPLFYQGTFSYRNAELIRDVCMERGIPYSFRAQEALLEANPALRQEVDSRFLTEQRFSGIYNTLDWLRFLSRDTFHTGVEKADLSDLVGCWYELQRVEQIGAVMPVRYQAALFLETALKLGLKDKEWTKYATELYKESKEGAMQGVDFVLTGIGGANVPAVAAKLLTSAVGKTPAELVGPVFKEGAKGAAAGFVALGGGSILLIPEANIAMAAALAGMVTGGIIFGGKELITRFQGTNMMVSGVRDLSGGKVSVLREGPQTVLSTRQAFAYGLAVHDGGNDLIVKMIEPGGKLSFGERINGLYVEHRKELIRPK